MKVCIFYPKNFYASWYALGGYAETLARMGHDVTDCPFPGNQVQNVEETRARLPGAADLASHDLVISFFHEYTQPWLKNVYGEEMWKRIMQETTVLARFDETMDRGDLGLPGRVPELLEWANCYSWPAAQDAEKYGGQFLIYGADATIFRPIKSEFEDRNWTASHASGADKKYNVAFIGTLYPKRQEYLSRLAALFPQDGSIVFNAGTCSAQDLGGVRGRDSAMILAENIRQIKIFFCLPPMSRLLVCKVAEVMGCGTFLMYPKLPWNCRDNMKMFKDKSEIVYYDPGYLGENFKQIQYYLENEEEREAIARAGCEKVHRQHTLEKMLADLLYFAVSSTGRGKVVEMSKA